MKPRIYADTSVLGGCEDEEFREYSRRLIAQFAQGESTLVLSELTIRELEDAPEVVRRVLASVAETNIESLQLTPEADELARAYVREAVVSERMIVDAQHIALATVARVDVLVSWNFRHIVNLRRIHAYNAVNLKRGYPLLDIRSPREVLSDE